MPDFTFAAGNRPTAAQWNAWVRDQVTTTCTDTTRPASPVVGRLIYETNTQRTLVWDGTAWIIVREDRWVNYTPTWTAATTNPVVGNGTWSSWWQWCGRKTINVDVQLTIGSTTTFGSGVWRFSLPASLQGAANRLQSGAAFTNLSGGPYPATAFVNAGNGYIEVASSGGYWGPAFPASWAAGAQVFVSLRSLEVA